MSEDGGRETHASSHAVLHVRAKPGAKVSRLVSLGGEPLVLEVAIGARPVEGQANEELLAFLARILGVRRRALSLARGDAARHKVVRIEGERILAILDTLRTKLESGSVSPRR